MDDPTRAVLDAVLDVYQAIKDEGPEPEYHHQVMAASRHAWPVLWAALDRLTLAVEGEASAQRT